MPDTFLEEISVFETSPTKKPANRWMSVFQKSDHMEEQMPFAKIAEEWVAKSDSKPELKEEIKKAFGILAKCKSEMSKAQWGAFRKAFGWKDEEETAEEEKKSAELKKSADDSAAALVAAKETVKKSVELLDAASPAVKPALDHLAALVGHTPVHQIIASLPEAARAQIEMIQKSAAETQKQLEELKKAQEEQGRISRRKEMVAKAADWKSVPLSAEDMGEIMQMVGDINPEAEKKLEGMFTAVNGVVQKSALFGERGSSARGVISGGTYDKVQAMAAEMVQKSAAEGKKMSIAKAVNFVFQSNPDLERAYEAERSGVAETLSKAGLL